MVRHPIDAIHGKGCRTQHSARPNGLVDEALWKHHCGQRKAPQITHIKYCQIWSNIVKYCQTVQQCAAMCSNIMRHHCNTSLAGLPYYTLLHHATPCDTMQHHATPCDTMLHHATPCNTMRHHATQLCNATAESKQIKTLFLRAELRMKFRFLQWPESLPAELQPSSQVHGRHPRSKLCFALSTWVPLERCQHHGLDAQPMSWGWGEWGAAAQKDWSFNSG